MPSATPGTLSLGGKGWQREGRVGTKLKTETLKASRSVAIRLQIQIR